MLNIFLYPDNKKEHERAGPDAARGGKEVEEHIKDE